MPNKPVRMKVTEAAKILCIDPENLRLGIRNGDYPFAVATKTSTHYTYVIIRAKFFDYIGVPDSEGGVKTDGAENGQFIPNGKGTLAGLS